MSEEELAVFIEPLHYPDNDLEDVVGGGSVRHRGAVSDWKMVNCLE